MIPFPAVDPIPLPAPVWLLKTLHITTLSLHFVAVEMLLGGLLVAWLLNLASRSPGARSTSAALGRRLPVVMTYVINLGVPPLLFAQVLYGRALYTSSVLIGAYWIAVIFLLMACYWLLYRFSAAMEAGRTAWPLGLAAWLLGGAIANIYTSNMTLMLRPEAWPGLYTASAGGLNLPHGDATILPRWLFMVCGGLLFAGLWMLYLAARRTFDDAARGHLARLGGTLAAVMAVVEISLARWVMEVQPGRVRVAVDENSVYNTAETVWLGVMALILILGCWSAVKRRVNGVMAWTGAGLALAASASMAIVRDGIRDQTLLARGYDVWQRAEASNWGVIALFLVVFVAGLGATGWLISVVARSRKDMEGVASA